jgi:hypothetical protein
MIAAKAKARESERKRGYNDGEGQRGKTSSKPTKSVRKELSDIANVAEETIHRAKVIAEKAPEPVKAALRAGTTTINRESETRTFHPLGSHHLPARLPLSQIEPHHSTHPPNCSP